MESHQTQIAKRHNLGTFGIFKESIKITIQNPKFTFLSLLVSLPLFCATLLHELALQRALTPIHEALSSSTTTLYDDAVSLDYLEIVFHHVSDKYLFPGLLNLGIVLAVDLLTTVAIINWASTTYLCSGESDKTTTTTIRAGFEGCQDLNLRAPLVTSAYVLLLASLAQVGLLWLAGQCYIHLLTGGAVGYGSGSGIVFAALFGSLFLVLFVKYEEWSGVWGVGVVVAAVEGGEKEGVVAVGVAASLTRACRLRGAVLAVVFFAAKVGLRAWSLNMVWRVHDTVSVVAVTGAAVGLGCVVNVMKWVVFVVYFWDCKERSMEKKVDAEDGRLVPAEP